LRSKILNPGDAVADSVNHLKGKYHDFPKKLWNNLTPGCPPACRYNVSGGRRRRRRKRRTRRRTRTRRRSRKKRGGTTCPPLNKPLQQHFVVKDCAVSAYKACCAPWDKCKIVAGGKGGKGAKTTCVPEDDKDIIDVSGGRRRRTRRKRKRRKTRRKKRRKTRRKKTRK